jgi:hypothetical protein
MRDRLVPKEDRECERPWAFDPSLLLKEDAALSGPASVADADPHPVSER